LESPTMHRKPQINQIVGSILFFIGSLNIIFEIRSGTKPTYLFLLLIFSGLTLFLYGLLKKNKE
ncbi:MAG: hypothetical protein KAT46_07815, partial [Deltaproteobacteria bacterium]|nr:hypothetical protein [Deltaproteobacteria bacterium]